MSIVNRAPAVTAIALAVPDAIAAPFSFIEVIFRDIAVGVTVIVE